MTVGRTPDGGGGGGRTPGGGGGGSAPGGGGGGGDPAAAMACVQHTRITTRQPDECLPSDLSQQSSVGPVAMKQHGNASKKDVLLSGHNLVMEGRRSSKRHFNSETQVWGQGRLF